MALTADRDRYGGWIVVAVLIGLVLASPYVPLLVQLVGGDVPMWDHIRTNLLARWVWNTVALVVPATILATAIGTLGAWLFERLALPRSLEVLFIAPITLPLYVSTYAWGAMLGFGGSVARLFGTTIPFAGPVAGALVLAFGLYPYVFLTVRAALVDHSRPLVEAVASLAGARRRDWLRQLARGVLPAMRPALFGGAALVAMEGLNAYATPLYLGIETISTGVFRAWFALSDLASASRLAGLILATVLLSVSLERLARGRRRFGAPSARPTGGAAAGPVVRWVAGAGLVVPPLVGFVAPVAQFAAWTVRGAGSGAFRGVGATAVRTLLLAAGSAGVILLAALVIAYASYLTRARVVDVAARIASVGYAVPGTVVAIGALGVFRAVGALSDRLFLFGTVGGLVFAYVARYLAVALQPVQGAFAQQLRSPVDAARALGRGPVTVLRRVVVPLFRPTLAGAALLVGVDVVKDLPLTLLLRPFDFPTLAVELYALAGDERLVAAAPHALLLAAVGLLTILVTMRPVRPPHRRARRPRVDRTAGVPSSR